MLFPWETSGHTFKQCLTSTKIFLLIVRHSGKLCKVKGEIKIAFSLKFKVTELPLPF